MGQRVSISGTVVTLLSRRQDAIARFHSIPSICAVSTLLSNAGKAGSSERDRRSRFFVVEKHRGLDLEESNTSPPKFTTDNLAIVRMLHSIYYIPHVPYLIQGSGAEYIKGTVRQRRLGRRVRLATDS